MSYSKDRDEFVAIASAEGLPLPTVRKLLRYASTLQRLAVAQCNGDWPYNGDRDRPGAYKEPCGTCSNRGHYPIGTECQQCSGTGWTWHRDEEADERHDKRYVVCPNCETSGVSKARMVKCVCPDCRTTELVKAVLPEGFKAVFQGDPRGCVFKLQVPSGRTNDYGKEGICVPARER